MGKITQYFQHVYIKENKSKSGHMPKDSILNNEVSVTQNFQHLIKIVGFLE